MTMPDLITAVREYVAYDPDMECASGSAIVFCRLENALRRAVAATDKDAVPVSRKLIEDAILICVLVHGEKERNEIVTDKALEIAKALKAAIQSPGLRSFLEAKAVIAGDLYAEGKISRAECFRHEVDVAVQRDSGPIQQPGEVKE